MAERRALIAGFVALSMAAAACSRSSSPPGSEASPAPSAPPIASVPPAASATATASAGPIAAIPAGKLVAGTACGDHPRSAGEELSGESVDLGPFDVDAYPYPNDPAKPALAGVSRDEAQKLCQARGRRLCTDLEWERACKGPANTRYEYGDRFDAKACPSGVGPTPDLAAFERCASGFGVHAMHGFVWEWTASDWKRGEERGKGVLRGGFGNQPYAHGRCTAVREADPRAQEPRVGFRCCGGPVNAAEVVIPPDMEPFATTTLAIDEENALSDALQARFKRALQNGKLADLPGTTSTITRAFRWRPAPKEELYVVRYETKLSSGAVRVQPLVIRLCERAVQLVGKLRGPLESMADPTTKPGAPGTVIIAAKDGVSAGDVRLVYQFGQVAVDQPSWIGGSARE